MTECDNNKIHKSSNFLWSNMSSNNVRHLITSTIITLQHFATLHHTSPNYTSLHLSTLHLNLAEDGNVWRTFVNAVMSFGVA